MELLLISCLLDFSETDFWVVVDRSLLRAERNKLQPGV